MEVVVCKDVPQFGDAGVGGCCYGHRRSMSSVAILEMFLSATSLACKSSQHP